MTLLTQKKHFKRVQNTWEQSLHVLISLEIIKMWTRKSSTIDPLNISHNDTFPYYNSFHSIYTIVYVWQRLRLVAKSITKGVSIRYPYHWTISILFALHKVKVQCPTSRMKLSNKNYCRQTSPNVFFQLTCQTPELAKMDFTGLRLFCFFGKIWCSLNQNNKGISGGSRIFLRGAPTPKIKMGVLTYYFALFLPRTAWKWKNLDPGGGASVRLLRCATGNVWQWLDLTSNIYLSIYFQFQKILPIHCHIRRNPQE